MKISNKILAAIILCLLTLLPVQAQENGAALVKTGEEFATRARRSKDEKEREELYKKALSCFVKAAKLKHSEGFYKIGRLFFAGHGVERSRDRAVEYFRKAIMTGYKGACYDIGLAYALDTFGEPNIAEAVKWMKLAAERGDTFAMEFLGRWYFTGKAGEKDYVKSRFYYGTLVKTAGEANAEVIIERIGRLERVMNTAQIEEAKTMIDAFTAATEPPALQ